MTLGNNFGQFGIDAEDDITIGVGNGLRLDTQDGDLLEDLGGGLQIDLNTGEMGVKIAPGIYI